MRRPGTSLRARLALALIAIGVSGPGIAAAQPAASLDALGRELEALSREHGNAPDALGRMVAVARQRQELLASLLRSDPGAVLAQALPADVRERLPAAVRARLERPVEIEGEVTALYVDAGNRSRLRHFLDARGRRRALHLAGAPPGLLTGDRVVVRGLEVPLGSSSELVAYCCGEDGLLALAGGNGRGKRKEDDGGVGSLPPPPTTTGERRVLTILVRFEDDPFEPYSAAHARDVVLGTTGDFLLENSYQQTWLTGDVAGWFAIPLPSSECDLFAIASHAKSAATAAGFVLTAYDHLVYNFPRGACTGIGVGTLGGSPSEAWIIGDLDLKVLSHELGHNLGLHHARALDCGSAVLGTDCSVLEYGDRIDTMGNVAAGHYNAFHKDLLGWFDTPGAPAVTEVVSDGVYALAPLEAGGATTAALAIRRAPVTATGEETWYYVEYRRPLGFDAFLATNANVTNGVIVHTGSPSNGNSSDQLDMTPDSALQRWADWSDPALAVGMSFHDPDTGVTITSLSASDAGAEVSVSFGGAVPVPDAQAAALDVAAASDRGVYRPNQTAVVSASVTLDGSPVAGASVSFRITDPAGGTTLHHVTTQPDGTAVVRERLRRRDPRGRYDVHAEAAHAAHPGAEAWTSFMLE